LKNTVRRESTLLSKDAIGTIAIMKSRILSCAMVLTLSLGGLRPVYGDSATWSGNPTTGDWFTAANWTPNTIPNGPDDIATFDVSTITDITVAGIAELDAIVFNPGASAYTLNIPWYLGQPNYFMIISGMGIVNNAGISQSFVSLFNDGYYSLATRPLEIKRCSSTSRAIIWIGAAASSSSLIARTPAALPS
jgi:hypothetical protein